ncbi:bifunctional riboflavin kinase/FAD synthetase [candidate division WOR-3 bacterium]|nr:bifunctional riboflavin kinase/FAD synthetase [candidate division WOR-3 bacterium]
MKIIKDIEELKDTKVNSVTVGSFDGLHLGHQAVIKRVIKKPNSLIVTFDPYPKEILPENKQFVLTLMPKKINILEQLGVKNLFILKFDKNLATLEPMDFVHWFIAGYVKPKEIILGYNHHFGNKAKGDFELLVHMGAKFDFNVTRVPPIFVDGFPVSSTRVRNSLTQGDVKEARKLLGRCYSITSQVIPGKKRGTTLTYPTANLKIPDRKLIPKKGVYAVWVNYDKNKSGGMMDIGEKLTFGEPFGLEVHIFDFNKNILNQKLTIEFVDYIRENLTFKSSEALKKKLKEDEICARNLLKIV